MGQPNIRARRSKQGILYYLDYIYNGVRHRPPLGHNLTKEQQGKRAHEEIDKIHAGPVATNEQAKACITFADFLPTFWQAFNAKGRVDRTRPELVFKAHLLPRYGNMKLSELNDPKVGMEYVTSRQRDGVTAGTIDREWHVLMRIINLAVDFDVLDKNRLSRVPRPETAKRERVVERWELEALRDKGGDADIWRAAVAAMHTGLRRGKLLLEAGDKERIKREEDGYWAYLDKSKSKGKGNIELMPLNQWAYESLLPGFRWVEKYRVSGKLTPYGEKVALGSFDTSWRATCERAGIKDLHFHDLRHLFATTLDELDVKDRYISILLGHAIEGSTTRYIRKNLRQLRDAVTRLEQSFNPTNLTVSGSNVRQIA